MFSMNEHYINAQACTRQKEKMRKNEMKRIIGK